MRSHNLSETGGETVACCQMSCSLSPSQDLFSKPYLAVERQVSASTQNQALSALLFLYREVLNLDIARIDAVRAKRPQSVPTMLTKQEAIAHTR